MDRGITRFFFLSLRTIPVAGSFFALFPSLSYVKFMVCYSYDWSHIHNRNEHITMDGISFFALLLGYTGGVFTVYLYQYLLRRRQRRAWINRNPRAHSALVERLQKEEWSER